MKDSSRRTTVIGRPRSLAIVALTAMVISVGAYTGGSIYHSDIAARSSSPVGTEMSFERSAAGVVLKGIYTDPTQSALVVRLSVNSTDNSKLPANGSDYRVFINSPALPTGTQEMDILFGRLSTDGDLFLVIPKPNQEVYSVYIMNNKYLASAGQILDQAGQVTENSPVDIASENVVEQSISKSLSEYQYNPDAGTSIGTIAVPDNISDVIAFRVTLDPAFKKDEYKPIVVDTELLSADGKFNFEGMFDKLFKESAYNELSGQHRQLLDLEKQLISSKSEYEARLVANPGDTDAQDALDETKSAITELTIKKTEIAAQMNKYESLEYSSTTFSNLQTKAKVIQAD